jgi:hypothetical protein
MRSFITMLENHAIFVSLRVVARVHRITKKPRPTVKTRRFDQPIYRKFGGQDKRDGTICRPSSCLHILSDGAMPWWHGAIAAPIACAASIPMAPNWRIRTNAPISLRSPSSQADGIDHDA